MILFIYFNPILGPDLLASYPDNIEEILDSNDLNQIKRLMDSSKPGFFTHSFSEELIVASLFFTIPSDWARGKQEMAMITKIIDEENPNYKYYKKVFKKFKKGILDDPEIFKALYHHNPPINYFEEVNENYEKLRKELEKISNSFSIQETPTIGKIMDLDAVETHKSIPLPSKVINDLKMKLKDNKNYFIIFQQGKGTYNIKISPYKDEHILKISIVFKGQISPQSAKMLSMKLSQLEMAIIYTTGICQEFGSEDCVYEAYFNPSGKEDFQYARDILQEIPGVFRIQFNMVKK